MCDVCCRSIRRTPSQLHSLQQIPTQHDMLPQHLVYKNELNSECVITLARNDETPWWWSEKIETCRSGFKCFKWKLYRCICWLIVEVLSACKPCMSLEQVEALTHLISIQGLHSLSCCIGRCLYTGVPLLVTIFSEWLACRLLVFLTKGETSQNGDSNVRLHDSRRYWN